MYTQKAVLSGGERRRLKREFNPAAFTRAEALAVVAASVDVNVLEKFKKHQNKRVAVAVSRRLDVLEHQAELRAKRSEAAKKAAATRKAKKEAV